MKDEVKIASVLFHDKNYNSRFHLNHSSQPNLNHNFTDFVRQENPSKVIFLGIVFIVILWIRIKYIGIY